MLSPDQVREAARRARVRVDAIGTLDAGGDRVTTGRLSSSDPWGAARLLVELAKQDAADPSVRDLALQWRKAYPDPADLARALHAYVRDSVMFVREPIETFQSTEYTLFSAGCGDCDDSARALYALARAAGLRARLTFLQKGGRPAHVYTEIYVRGKWYPAETTIAAEFGENPLAAAKRVAPRGRSDLDAGSAVAIEGLTIAGGKLTVSAPAHVRMVVRMTKAYFGSAPSTYARDLFTDLGFDSVAAYTEAPGDFPAALKAGIIATWPEWLVWIDAKWSKGETTFAETNDSEGYVIVGAMLAPDGPAPQPVPVKLTADIPAAFFPHMLDAAKRQNLNAEAWLMVMNHESGLDHAARNPNKATGRPGIAFGINQLLAANLVRLGWTGAPDDFLDLNADEQLSYAERFYAPYKAARLDTLERMYQANFLPATLPLGSDPALVLVNDVRRHGPSAHWQKAWGDEQAVYDENKGLDYGNKGWITVGDLGVAARASAKTARFQEALARLRFAAGGANPPSVHVVGKGGLIALGVGLVLAAGAAIAYATH